jgi:hypothetical protein
MKVLAIDLEQTVIDNIWQGNLLHTNILKIKQLVAQEKPDKIVTFSWALIDESDFEMWAAVQAELANAGLLVETQAFSVRQLQQDFLKNRFSLHRLPSEDSNAFLQEFASLCKKELAFEWWATKQTFDELILVDDMVPNKTVTLPDQNKTIRFINI